MLINIVITTPCLLNYMVEVTAGGGGRGAALLSGVSHPDYDYCYYFDCSDDQCSGQHADGDDDVVPLLPSDEDIPHGIAPGGDDDVATDKGARWHPSVCHQQQPSFSSQMDYSQCCHEKHFLCGGGATEGNDGSFCWSRPICVACLIEMVSLLIIPAKSPSVGP